MRTNLSNTTPELFAAHVARLEAYHKKLREGQKAEPPTRQEPDLTPEVERLGITIKMAKRWMFALLNWRKAGYPTRTQKEVARIIPICKSNECGQYIAGRCKKCGCGVNSLRLAIVNKAKMATEKCPLGKW